MKGCICLDIDGTLTADPFSIPLQVWECLEYLYARGWQFLISTGRPYSFASRLFANVKIPFFLSLQNGADFLEMPYKKQLFQNHLSSLFIPQLELLHEDLEEDFLIYSGFSKGDFCYYRPDRFSLKMQEHLEIVKSLTTEPWEARKDFVFGSTDSFPLIKSFGTKKQMDELEKKLASFPMIHSTSIANPLSNEDLYLNLITASAATKGESVKKMRSMMPPDTFFIAAGDDRNDISMLQEADFAIVMKNAASDLLPLADILAEPAKNFGIIDALLTATGERRC